MFLAWSFTLHPLCIPLIPCHLSLLSTGERQLEKNQALQFGCGSSVSHPGECYGSLSNAAYSLFVTKVREENNAVWHTAEEAFSPFSLLLFKRQSVAFSVFFSLSTWFSPLHASALFLASFQNLSISLALPLSCLRLIGWFIFQSAQQTL